MGNASDFLVDWSIRFFENKDIIKKEITKIEKNENGFDFAVHYKDKVKYFIVRSILGGDIFNKVQNDGYFGIVTLNNPVNIKFVVIEWKKLSDIKFLSAYFINPFSNSDKVWAINPYFHDKVCDKGSLEPGLKSMAEMVVPLGVEELNNKIKLLK